MRPPLHGHGHPAKVARPLRDQEVDWKSVGTRQYVELAERSINTMREIEPLAEEQADRPRYTESEHQPKIVKPKL